MSDAAYVDVPMTIIIYRAMCISRLYAEAKYENYYIKALNDHIAMSFGKQTNGPGLPFATIEKTCTQTHAGTHYELSMSVGQTTNNKIRKISIFHFSYFSSAKFFFFLFCYCDFVSVRWCDFSTSVPSIFRRDASSMKFHIARQLRISS